MQKKANQNDFAKAPLLKVEQRNDGTQAVSARDLYEFLEIKTKFTAWCERMFEYGFEENQDYVLVSQKRETNNPKNPYTTETDYALTIDTAKEIAMLQRSDKGKEARKYFIECEKQLKATLTPAQMLLQQAQQLVEQEKRLKKVEKKQDFLVDRELISQGFTTVGISAKFYELTLSEIQYKKLEGFCIEESKVENYKYYEDPLSGEKMFFVGVVVKAFMMYKNTPDFLNPFL